MERQRKELEAATRGTGITVSRTPDNQLKLAIPTDVSFDTNSAYIKSQFRPVLNNFADSLKRYPQTHVVMHRPHGQHRWCPHQRSALRQARQCHPRLHLQPWRSRSTHPDRSEAGREN